MEHSKFAVLDNSEKGLLLKATNQLKYCTFAISYYSISLYVISSMSFTKASIAGSHQN